MSQTSLEISGSATPTSKAAAKFNNIQSSSITACTSCGKRVYDMEKISIDQQLIFHKNCFRCCHCNGILTVRNYTMDDGKLYCQQHYMRQFREIGGKYNFTGVQTTPARSGEVTSPSIQTSLSRTDSGHSDTPRPVRSWEPTRLDGEKDVGAPSAVERSSSITDSGSRNAAVVANIRNKFETPRNASGAGAVHGYVEGELSVISMMRQSSSVKARMAQFSGTGGASVDQQRDSKPPPIRPITPPPAEPEHHLQFAGNVQTAPPEPNLEDSYSASRDVEEEVQVVETVNAHPEYEEQIAEEEQDNGDNGRQHFEDNYQQEFDDRDRYDDNLYQNNGGQPDYNEYENEVGTTQQQHFENSYSNGHGDEYDAEAEGHNQYHDDGGEYDGHQDEDGAVEYSEDQ